MGEEIRPAVVRERDVDRRQDRDDVVILDGTNGSFRREGAMVVERNIFIGEVGRLEESSKLRRSFVVKGKKEIGRK